MASPWLFRLARVALALLLVFSTVDMTVAVAARTVAESAPVTDDDDFETEIATPTAARQAHQPNHTPAHTSRPSPRTSQPEPRLARAASVLLVASADPLGTRLRC